MLNSIHSSMNVEKRKDGRAGNLVHFSLLNFLNMLMLVHTTVPHESNIRTNIFI